MTTRKKGRHNKRMTYCETCKRVVRSLARHNRRHHNSPKRPTN